jgi:Tol biopolymer transport system component
MVSPAVMHGALIQPLGHGGGQLGATTQAASGGAAVAYAANSPTEAHPVGFPPGVEVLSTRGSAGWSSQDVSAPHAVATGLALSAPEVRLFSEDLSLAAVQPLGSFVASSPEASELALSPAASEQTAYLRENHTGAYTPLVTGCPAEPAPCPPAVAELADVPAGTVFGQLALSGEACPRETVKCGAVFVGASPDLKHVIVSAHVPLRAGAPAEALYEWNAGAPPSQQLQLVSLLPPEAPGGEELPATNPTLGLVPFPSPDQRGAVSADGSRVFFSAQSHLYMRDMAADRTVQIDAFDPGCKTCSGGQTDPEFQSASADGTKVFFTDTEKLTEDGEQYPEVRNNAGSPQGADLYVCEIHGSACSLKDLTPSGSVLGEPAGVSKDGSWVYFVANGVLAPGAVKGLCANVRIGGNSPPSVSCNLYVEHYEAGTQTWASPRLIAVLSGSDETDWRFELEGLTVRVAPDGEWLAFMSQRSLTGYDNRDAVSGRPDQEVYLYEAAHGRLTCASCDPSGARPHGVEYGSGGVNVPLLGNEEFLPETWLSASIPAYVRYAENRAEYQPRYLSNSGRLFFDSHDDLVPKDVNNTGDVYEFQPAGVPEGPQACGSGTASGASVYRPKRSFKVEGLPEEVEEMPGCVGLMSSGSSSEESAFFDASESGGDVFFISTAKLSPADVEGGLAVYDAHECTTASPCIPPPAASPPPCTTEASCKAAPSPQPSIFGPSGSATFSGPGNPAPPPPPKAKTAAQLRAEKLTKALKACHKLKRHAKRKACERAAHKRYGAKSARRAKRAATTSGRAGR